MKQSDIFSIIIIATVGTMAAYFGVNAFLGDPNLQSANIKTVNEILATLEEPDPELFNPDAINPTVEVYVGECKDVDQNNILSVDELLACGQITQEQVDNQDIFTCNDGTKVLDLNTCPENQQPEQPEEIYCPDGTRVTDAEQCNSVETPEEQ